jgi:hypothetical protein
VTIATFAEQNAVREGGAKTEHSLFKMHVLPARSPDQKKERPQTLPNRTNENPAYLQMWRFSEIQT